MGGIADIPTASNESRGAFLQGLDDRISAIEDNWQQLSAHWQQAQLEDLYSRICELSEQSEQLQLHQLNESLISLEVYLSSFVDSPQRPSSEQQQAVGALLRGLRTTAESPAPAPSDEADDLPPLPQARSTEPAADSGIDQELEADSELALPDAATLPLSDETPLLLFLGSHSPAAPVVALLGQRDLDLRPVNDSRGLLQALRQHKCRLILADHSTLPEIEAIQEELDQARNLHANRPPLVFISNSNELPLRVRAMRAGGEAYFVTPLDDSEVVQRLVELSSPGVDQACRIMVVEDDPAQAEFASSILRKAKMDVLTVTDPLQVMAQLEQFHPNLILMDIYMPDVNGIELTAIIRDHKEFVATPIVFLSGEQSTDKQMDALSVGGDDFIAKPIRPKHLLHVVNHRIRRISHLQQVLGSRERLQHAGLVDKPKFTAKLSHSLQQADTTPSAVYHLTVDQMAQIREQFGLGTQDVLMGQLLQRVVTALGPHDLLCRLDDHSITLLIRRDEAEAIGTLAEQLRQQTADQPFQLDGRAHALTISLGLCELDNDEQQDAAGVITRAARASAKALATGGDRVLCYQPAPPTPEDSQTKALRGALEQGGFVVLYQPLLDLQTRGSQNYQVLLHLPNEEGDLQGTRQLRGVAAKAGLLLAMDRWLLTHAMDLLVEHRDPERDIRLFIPQHVLPDEDSLAWLQEQLQQRKLDGSELVLEFQLAQISKSMETARILSERLRELKVGLCLSRFSEKPAAFKVLRLLRAQYIRVAPRLLKADRDTISHIINQAHLMSAQVIVSNVDDPRSIDLHWSSGADYLQGDFIQQPLEDMDYDFSQVVI